MPLVLSGVSELYDMLGVADHAALADKAYHKSPMEITPAILEQLHHDIVQLDDNEVMVQWCVEWHVDLSDDSLDWN